MLAKNLIPRKETLTLWLMPAIVILVGLTAFGLGRLSALEEQQGELKVYEPKKSESQVLGVTTGLPALPAQAGQAGEYIASKSGTKYYLSTCSGAKNIKEENKLWFPTAEAAQGAGYAPATNCKGL